MGDNASDVSKLAVILIAVAVLIGLVFMVFAIGKSLANEGVTKVQSNLDQVQSSEFNDYDEKIVTGTQVLAAINNFEGKSTAILIATKAESLLDDVEELNDTEANFAGDDNERNAVTVLDADPDSATGSATGSTMYFDSGKTAKFINYNAILDTTKGGGIWNEDGVYKTNCAFLTKDNGNGDLKFYNSKQNINKSGMTEYIPSGAKFKANLLKDKSGTNVGVVFMQTSVEIKVK